MVVGIWQVMFGNGARIGLQKTIIRKVQIEIHLGLRMAISVFCVAVAGSMLVIIAGAPSVTASCLLVAPTVSAFALPGLCSSFPLCPFATFSKIFLARDTGERGGECPDANPTED